MAWPYIIATALSLGWMLSPDALVRLGNGVAANRTLFLVALAFAALLTARGIALIRHPALRNNGRCSQTSLLIQGAGRLPAMSLLLASRLAIVLLLPTGLLVSAGFAFNEIFLYWFPNFGFAFLLLGLITLLHLAGERIVTAAQPIFAGLGLLCLLILCLAGLGGPASSRPVSMDIGFSFTPEVAVGALLLFLGTDYMTPSNNRDSRLPPLAALFFCLSLFLLWAMLSLQYVPYEQLLDSTIPHLLVAREILGETGRILMGCLIISTTCGAVNTLFHQASSTLAELGERNLLPGHTPNGRKKRLFVLLFALIIGALMIGGLAGHDIIETYIQASLLLWLLLFALLCFAAGRILYRNNVARAWHGFVLATLFTGLAFFMAASHHQAVVIFRFILLTLTAASGISAFWLWKQPAFEVIPPRHKHKGDTQ
ncbi:hypothetical protein [Desulfopila aestuarii]|uniref:Amino acid transporter n=1 Tax=Desulfopila aestuarii DSM 18488 TaxID=1121416 RepID=A0A1M7XVT7_9BACT|nr:hypothetical protein [Desulfopila aestuarii]SHO42779.1 Amino acid transporter [Desulfopila aestuarii DSM 18488]